MNPFALGVALTFAVNAASVCAPHDGAEHVAQPSHAALSIPLTVAVDVAPDIHTSLLQRLFDEVAAIWHPSGIAVNWYIAGAGVTTDDPLTLHVTIDDGRGHAPEGETPLGWITFGAPAVPGRDIHLSRANGLALLSHSSSLRDLPVAGQEVLLGRALGRALAHEIGHYLLGSKGHTSSGLMQSHRSVGEFFSPDRAGFGVSPAQVVRVKDASGTDVRALRCARRSHLPRFSLAGVMLASSR